MASEKEERERSIRTAVTPVLACARLVLASCGGALLLILASCGGGGGGDTDDPRPAIQGTLATHGASSDGSRVRLDVDFDGLFYDWVPEEGPSERVRRQGALTRRGDLGGMAFETSGGDSLLVLPDRAAVLLTAEGELTVGVERLTRPYDLGELAGAYNFLAWNGTGFGYGTIQVFDDHAYAWWEEGPGDGAPDETGTLLDRGDGVLQASDDAGAEGEAHHAFLFRPAGAETLLVVADFVGERIVVGSRQGPIPTLDGAFTAVASYADAAFEVSIRPPVVTTPSGDRLYLYNVPWNGFAFHQAGLFEDLLVVNPVGFAMGIGHEGFLNHVWVAVK